MMSLIDLDDDQRWVPTHVNVTVLRARGLRTKGKHGSRYLYTVIQVGKEKYTTGLVERAEVPEWNEECCFELLPGILEEGGRGAYPSGSGDLLLTVMHRVLIGLDVFLGQATIPLDKIFQDGMCPRDEWLKLNSKAGRKEKARGELQVTVQFTRNNMTASMFDLTMKDKPRSAFGKLKDRVTGRKRGDMESSSAILPGRYAALSGTPGQPSGEGRAETVELGDADTTEEKRSKVKDFFKGKLRRSSDTRSCSSLASESSMSSMASDSLGPPPSLDLLADPPSSPIYTSKARIDAFGEIDLAKKVLTSQHTTKVLTHKRAFSDEASKITTSFRTYPAAEALKGQTMTHSTSSLCINGSHVYDSEPPTPKSSAALPSKLVLLEKCSPLSRSLQNLTKRSEDRGYPGEGRRWSFDKLKKEEKEEERESQATAPAVQSARIGGRPAPAETQTLASIADPSDKGKKQRKALFSGGRSDSVPAKSDQSQAGHSSEGRLRGWFGSSDSQHKPRLEVSPKVESTSDVPPPLPLRSPIHHSPPTASPTGHVSPDKGSHAHPFTPSSCPPSTPISNSNPFLVHMQRNPFFEELIAEELQRSPPLVPRSPSATAPPQQTPSTPCSLASSNEARSKKLPSARRERPRPVARQISLPAFLPRPALPSPDHTAPRSMSESGGEWGDSFDAFASSRLNSPKVTLSQKALKVIPSQAQISYQPPVNDHSVHTKKEQKPGEVLLPPLPPRRLLRTHVNEMYADTWLHRGQQLAVQKEACLLSQTGVASLQHGREAERKRNTPSISPDHPTTSETSDSLSVHAPPCENTTSPGFKSVEKLKKFKYEPLEDEADCWKGMLFEQDLYGRVGMGNRGEGKVNGKLSSKNFTLKDTNPSQHGAWGGNKLSLDEKMLVTDLLLSSTTTLPKSNMKDLGKTSATSQSTVQTLPEHRDQTLCKYNTLSHSLTLQDLNMNVNNSDFTFIDSEGSSPSDRVENLKGADKISPQPWEDLLLASDPMGTNTPDHVSNLINSNIPQNSISPVISTSPNELVNCKSNNSKMQNNCEVKWMKEKENASSLQSLASAQPYVQTTESRQDITKGTGEQKMTLDGDLDGNGNLQDSLAPPNNKDSSPLVVSARVRPNGTRLSNEDGCPKSHSAEGETTRTEGETILDKVSQSFKANEHNRKPLVSPLKTKDNTSFTENDAKSSMVSQAHPKLLTLTEKHTLEDPPTEQMGGTKSSFEDLHAKVAPGVKTPSRSKMGQPSFPSSIVLSASAGSLCTLLLTNTPPAPSLSRALLRTVSNSTLAVAPFTTSSSFSTSTTAQPLIDAQHTLLPEEIDPASNLPHQESSPHPVKPLYSTASQPEKKEGRSVLEKLKSTIHPGRMAHQSTAEPEKSQQVTVDNSAQYQHLTNMELIALLLQQEMDMQKQQSASEQQGALLEKREAELKKVKMQVRDMEDYIDNLLLRIMEQTPTLLQVRSRHK